MPALARLLASVGLAGLSAGIALSASLASAQTVPNFNGTWYPIPSPNPAMTATTQTVIQTDATLTMKHASSGNGHALVYRLDGLESRSTTGHGASVSRVSVGEHKLTITRVDTYSDGRIRENTQVWSLDAAGNLVIDATDGLRGEPPVNRRQVYRKRGLPAPGR